MTDTLPPSQVTLGILAGGRATRLGGRDKAWLARDGQAQVVRLATTLAGGCGAVLVSANAGIERYAAHGLATVRDRVPGVGPIGGLDAFAAACRTPWLLTVPVDVVNADECLLRILASAGGNGAVAQDQDGPQPLVALYRCDRLRQALPAALESGDYSVKSLQVVLGLHRVRFDDVRFGNLNTPADLRAAGFHAG